jgi:hypothetical protein
MPQPAPGFYLAGGTALALQLGHRVSVDLDWMHDEPISETLLPAVERTYAGRQLDVRVNNSAELTFFADGVKVTFLHYPFRLLFPTIECGKVSLAALRDIAGMKAYAIGRRAAFKDYVDIYFILKHGVDLNGVISIAQKKFGSVFDPRLFLEQLVYFDDLADTTIQFAGEPVQTEDLEKFFEQETAKLKLE